MIRTISHYRDRWLFFSSRHINQRRPVPVAKDLEELFRYEVLKMKSQGQGLISDLIAFILWIFNHLSSPDPNSFKNLEEVADQLARWSKQSSTGNLSPQAQQKLGQLLLETSKLLKEMGMKSGDEMNMEHHKKIEMMKKDWDPFDTSDRM